MRGGDPFIVGVRGGGDRGLESEVTSPTAGETNE